MKLYGSLTSPYVRKVRALVLEKGIRCDFVVEGPHDAAGNVARLNPLGKVPVLSRDNGEVLFDSPLIVEYLDGLQGEPMIPAAGEERWRVQRWHALAQGICDAAVARLMETRRPQGKQDPGVITRQEGKIAAAMQYAEDRLGDGTYVAGERFSLADIALAVAMEYVEFRYPHDWHRSYARLARWLTGIGTRACLKETRFPNPV